MTVGSPSTIIKRISPSKARFPKFKVNLSIFKRNNNTQEDNKSEDGRSSVVLGSTIQEVILNFEQNLEQHHFAVAGKQLICREEHLFAQNNKQQEMGISKSMLEDDEETKLDKDFEKLFEKIMSTIENSFNTESNEDIEFLKEAVQAIDQEEEQDRRWEGVANDERPPWRPRCCRREHDRRLQEMVTKRMEEAKLDSNVNITSSVQLEITAMGKQLKEDLLKIAKNMMSCYPKENVCQLYAEKYHQVFSDKLREIADYGLADDDCTHVLQWVNNHYPMILRHEKLSGLIEFKHLDPLLPGDILEQLEEQFLTTQENKLQAMCQTALDSEKTTDPELSDNCYLSHLATDVIQCVHGLLTTSKDVLGSWSKIQGITHEFKHFFINYQQFLEKLTADNPVGADAVLKANLPCISSFMNYITTNPDPFPQHIRNDCMDLLTQIKDTCLSYFTKMIHKNLKGTYSKLGTQVWIKQSEQVCSELLQELDKHIKEITYLHEACFQELVNKLHEEVLAEYVRKMMKKKIRFKDGKKQQQAAEALHLHNQRIHTLFTEAGSNMNGLEDILPKLAEVLTLNDPDCIEFQLVTLANIYPDFSEAHVSAWLNLKATLSASQVKKIKKTFALMVNDQKEESTVDGHDPHHSCRNFFSKVTLK